MISKFKIKLLDKDMKNLVGLNGKPLEANFDSLVTVDFEVEYLLSQLQRVESGSKYHLVISDITHDLCNVMLREEDLNVTSIVKRLKDNYLV